jgi:hypothetical protein
MCGRDLPYAATIAGSKVKATFAKYLEQLKAQTLHLPSEGKGTTKCPWANLFEKDYPDESPINVTNTSLRHQKVGSKEEASAILNHRIGRKIHGSYNCNVIKAGHVDPKLLQKRLNDSRKGHPRAEVFAAFRVENADRGAEDTYLVVTLATDEEIAAVASIQKVFRGYKERKRIHCRIEQLPREIETVEDGLEELTQQAAECERAECFMVLPPESESESDDDD